MDDTARSAGPEGLIRGVLAAARGLPIAFASREVRAAYWQLVGVLLLGTAVLGAAMVYGVWVWTDPGPGGLEGAGAWVVRVVGIFIVLLASPMLALLAVNIVFPLFAERVFFAGMRVLAPARAQALEQRPGLPVMTSVTVALKLAVFFVALSIIAALLTFVPVVGPVLAPVMQLWVTAKTLGWELLDPYFDKHELRFAEQRGYAKRHGMAMAGFALPYSLLLALPLVGPLFFGIAQAAAARLVVDVLAPEHDSAPPAQTQAQQASG